MKLQEYLFRRQTLLAKMKPDSAALIFAAPATKRSADSEYPYRQHSDFWYFTGFNEPQALLILLKSGHLNHHSILFHRSRNNADEIWTGKRLGQEALLEHLGVARALPWHDISRRLYLLLNGLQVVYHAQGEYHFADTLLFSALDKLRSGRRKKLQAPATLVDWRPWVHDMRLRKSEEELAIIRQTCNITSLAHLRAMKQCRPGMYEYQLEGEILHEFNRHGARYPSYNTIVGSGENGCILHYTENASKIKSGDLVLIDAGCEYQGYNADITRTFPVNGRFSPEQHALYNLVLAMLNRALELYGPGQNIQSVSQEAVRIMVSGLVKLGVMQGDMEQLIKENAYRQFFMHSLSHWLGLDVHDVGDYSTSQCDRPLEPGMVLTVEPGIYISNDANVPHAYRGIGIRIEDNIVITASGNENLTASVVKNATEIEAIMALATSG
ncbi:Xaa-Pro aminopeptidase [secondary endosymbiont of Ctenarytaina eucalypti]|uniref:Xaa-Pro aminopeptidase n=1 Tax=secondary endosymbiont of Ctenarytaina eucalypti TaxID=1199245 RepID=J3TXJ9_9ENTR|nr:Xaa-Pro aminopeptidase [secondary endosymbiont of Ctenarytaina eucalypti]AFP84920.1 Xaa-Pro aminopeptidase [secondary endosymbiont of Ctenarytaina eucalypti]